jgi:hypothetical protein
VSLISDSSKPPKAQATYCCCLHMYFMVIPYSTCSSFRGTGMNFRFGVAYSPRSGFGKSTTSECGKTQRNIGVAKSLRYESMFTRLLCRYGRVMRLPDSGASRSILLLLVLYNITNLGYNPTIKTYHSLQRKYADSSSVLTDC